MDALVYDIESASYGQLGNTDKHVCRVFACYSYKTNKYYYIVDDFEKIRKIIDSHEYLIGFNTLAYDNKVLYNNGLNDLIYNNGYDYLFSKKINIDLIQIFKKRAGSMKVKEGLLGDLLMSYSLDFISKTIGVADDSSGKKDLDYALLDKKQWTKEEYDKIKEYTIRDIEVTKRMYEWLEEYFQGFKSFISTKDVAKKSYLTSSIGALAYKSICHNLGWEEEYSNEKGGLRFEGAFVSYPSGEEFVDNIEVMDFASLYPHCMIQCNLYSPTTGIGWHGGKLFKTTGMYNDKELGQVEQLLKNFYALRKEFKKNKDPREYSVKIILNTIYGCLGNQSFKKLYNRTAASDCTSLARQFIKYTRKRFKDEGYVIIYSDTDSLYLQDPFKDKAKFLALKQLVIDEIKSSLPFPQETFDLVHESSIKNIWFFRGKNDTEKETDNYLDAEDLALKQLGFMKKNYIYLTMDDKLVVKNLGMMKKSTSAISRKVFWSVLKPLIIKERKIKFEKKFIEDTVYKLLEEDLSLACVRYNVDDFSIYKSASQLQAQISKKFGAGIHFLIPNKKIGVGIGKKYCTEEEFKKANLTIKDLDLSNVWSELAYFMVGEGNKIDDNFNCETIDCFFKPRRSQ